MINNRRTICILGGTGTVGVTACKVLSKLGYSLRVSVRNIETIKDTGMYMAPNIQLFELDIDKESNIGKFFKGSDLVIGAIGPSADYSEKMLLEAMAENIPYVDPGGIHLIRKMRNSSMKGTAIVGSGIFPGLSGWMLSSVLKEAFNDDLIEMIIGGVYNFSKAAAIDYVEEIKSYKAYGMCAKWKNFTCSEKKSAESSNKNFEIIYIAICYRRNSRNYTREIYA